MNLVLKKQADLFTIEKENGEIITCKARKNMKKDGIFVGDFVILDGETISKIEKRKNCLVRPPLSNIDKMFITIAPVPKPDLYTVDKLLLFCFLNKIEPLICINKCDLDEKYCKNIEKIYKKVAKTLIFSNFDGSVKKLKSEINGICVLTGQSAVGKSTIINSLLGENVAEVGDFSKKIERGKQTTRTVQLFKFGENKYLADTAGFSKLDEALLKLDEREVKNYYSDFLEFAQRCKYSSCLHLSQKDCGVFEAVQKGKIDKNRYENYEKLIKNLKKIKKY